MPSPAPVLGPVPPGTVNVTIDGVRDPAASSRSNEDRSVTIDSPDYTLEFAALDATGRSLPLGGDNQLQPLRGQRVSISGHGFHPATYAAVYVHDPQVSERAGRWLSEPVIIGAVLVDQTGRFTGSWVLPDAVAPGEYVLQVVGTTTDLEALSANMGMTVQTAETPSIIIRGERGTGRATVRSVFVYGKTEGLDGKTIQTRVRMPGRPTYSSGSVRTVSNGEFQWQRIANRRVHVYFQVLGPDGQMIRSQRIIIPGP